jgi:SAM-dependent methyltransferase
MPIYRRRVEQLVRYVGPYLRAGDRVLDVGCGSGSLGRAIMAAFPSVEVVGIERARRGGETIPVRQYEGGPLPYADSFFDVVILADVLHHERDPHALLGECSRVAKRFLILKDHKKSGPFAQTRLALLDWGANWPYDVPCLFRYNTESEWRRWHDLHRLDVEREWLSLRLYPAIVNTFFGGRLHYLAVLRPRHDAQRKAAG